MSTLAIRESVDTGKTLLYLGVAVGVLYLIYKAVKLVPQATDAVAKPLADFYVWLTSSGQAIPSGIILMPNGNYIPVSQLQIRPVGGSSNSATFNYAGVTYYLNTPSDANGNWAASLTLS